MNNSMRKSINNAYRQKVLSEYFKEKITTPKISVKKLNK